MKKDRNTRNILGQFRRTRFVFISIKPNSYNKMWPDSCQLMYLNIILYFSGEIFQIYIEIIK